MTQKPKQKPKRDNDRLNRGVIAFILAMVFMHFSDRLLGVRIEVFTDISYFSFLWIIDVFFVPFIAGIIVSVIYGLGGKWLCYLPPILVRAISYYEVAGMTGAQLGGSLIPLGWWAFMVIVVVEAAVIGGVLGEVLIKKTYGRSTLLQMQKKKQPVDPQGPNS